MDGVGAAAMDGQVGGLADHGWPGQGHRFLLDARGRRFVARDIDKGVIKKITSHDGG
jgi:hypothetical protein